MIALLMGTSTIGSPHGTGYL